MASCEHQFHVDCIEKSVVSAHSASPPRCPCCRVAWANAPGLVALACNEPRRQRRISAVGLPQSSSEPDAGVDAWRPSTGATVSGWINQWARDPNPVFALLPDVASLSLGGALPLPEEAAAEANAGEINIMMRRSLDEPPSPAESSLAPSWAVLSAVTDVAAIAEAIHAPTSVTVLLKIAFADDEDAHPIVVPADFVILADVSGSMGGAKIEAVRDALLKISEAVGPQDRCSLCSFNGYARDPENCGPWLPDPIS